MHTSTPNVARVQSSDVDILDDDVGHAVGETQTLALDDTSGALADDALVALDLDAGETSLVVGDADLGGRGLVVVAPVVCFSLVSVSEYIFVRPPQSQ